MDQSLLAGLAPTPPKAKDEPKRKSSQPATAAAPLSDDEAFGPVVAEAEPSFVAVPDMPGREALDPNVVSDKTPIDPQRVREFAKKQAALKEKEEFLAKIAEARKPLEPKAHVPPARAQREIDTTNAEMAEGARQSAIHEARKLLAKPRPVDPTEARSVPIPVPADYVPKMTQGQKASASVRQLG
jgi:hypothetical protein